MAMLASDCLQCSAGNPQLCGLLFFAGDLCVVHYLLVQKSDCIDMDWQIKVFAKLLR